MISRRSFIKATSSTTAATCMVPGVGHLAELERDADPQRVVVGIMGLSRGLDLAKDLAKIPGVEIRYACDPDEQRLGAGVKRIEEMGAKPIAVQDFRRILDDREVDALVCAAPNHWHGPATILGCKAGKHVYVEKPCSHNPAEGEWMVAAAHKHSRCVQMGTQRRSGISFLEGMKKLHEGVIGKCYLARANFQRTRESIGKTEATSPPATLDYTLWQGPVPKRPFHSNIVHYHWHWFWDYGNGELGNNGVHCLDLCRWGLQVDYPERVISSGGKYLFDDDQETPDTHSVSFEFREGKQITYQGSSRNNHAAGPFVLFYGTEGSMEMNLEGGYKIFDLKHKEVESHEGSGWGQKEHLQNFIDAVAANDPAGLHQPILEGHKSTLLCHLGNIAHRADTILRCNPDNGHLEDKLMSRWWRREYDPAWDALITG